MRLFITLSLLLSTFAFSARGTATITGTLGACIGDSSVLTVSSGGGIFSGSAPGTWSSSNITVATVGSAGIITGGGVDSGAAAVVTGISAGTATITFTDTSGAVLTAVFTVTATPAGITGGPTSFCVGSSATFSDATPGGTWSSDWGVTITAAGVATGASGGVSGIYYTVGPGCYAAESVTVNATTVASLDSETGTVCVGSTVTLTDATAGGTWSSSNPAIATIGSSTGVVNGISAGLVTITYSVSGGCGAAFDTTHVVVSSTTSAGTISGASVMYIGGLPVTLTDGSSPGVWSGSSTPIATVGSSTGVVTAVSAGTATITYTVTGCGGTAFTTAVVTVSALNGISGHVLFTGGFYYGNVKVWLITYNPSTLDLEAVDSTIAVGSGTDLYYQFLGAATDSFRMKAALIGDTAGITTGYIPTYHDTSFYWHDATVLYHISGTSDLNQNISMLSGTTASGPGFIAGNVLTGANRSTSGSIPVVGMHMAVLNTTTNTIAGMAFTDASGNYSFSNLPYGTYTVFPDSVNYATTPLTGITLSSSSATFSAATFIQHTVAKTITPGAESVKSLSSVSCVTVFPNPTNGKLNIQWTEKTAEKGTLKVSDLTGREVYNATINMNEGTGSYAVDLSEFSNGLYLVKIKTATLDYDNKIEIQH